jgi:Ca2+-binding EF-hand superfamily protein
LNDTESEWVYRTAEELNGQSVWGLKATYGGGGYVKDLADNIKETKEIVQNLKSNLWLDRGTRAVFIDFTVYNGNVNLFSIVKLFFEYPATGGLTTYYSIRTLKLIRYVDAFDFIVLACECIFVLYLLYYYVEEMIEIYQHRLKYFANFWNIMDIVVIALATMTIAFNIMRHREVNRLFDIFMRDQTQFPNFETLSYFQTAFNNVTALGAFLSYVKLFKYLSFNKTMLQLQVTITNCAKDVLGFGIMFFIIFLAYTQWGYLLFGTQVKGFSDFTNSFYTLFNVIMGSMDTYDEMVEANRGIGPLFFLSYVFFVFFVLINMFVAIITDSYSEVKVELDQKEDELNLADYVGKQLNKVASELKFKQERAVNMAKALELGDKDGDGVLTFYEWKKALLKQNYSEDDIEVLFAKYDVDGDGTLDKEEQETMLEELRAQAAKNGIVEEVVVEENPKKKKKVVQEEEKEPEPDSNTTFGHFIKVARRVDMLERSIEHTSKNLEVFLNKFESSEKSHEKKRNTIDQLLQNIEEVYHESQKPALERLSKRRTTEGSLSKTKAPNKSKRGSVDGLESTASSTSNIPPIKEE